MTPYIVDKIAQILSQNQILTKRELVELLYACDLGDVSDYNDGLEGIKKLLAEDGRYILYINSDEEGTVVPAGNYTTCDECDCVISKSDMLQVVEELDSKGKPAFAEYCDDCNVEYFWCEFSELDYLTASFTPADWITTDGVVGTCCDEYIQTVATYEYNVKDGRWQPLGYVPLGAPDDAEEVEAGPKTKDFTDYYMTKQDGKSVMVLMGTRGPVDRPDLGTYVDKLTAAGQEQARAEHNVLALNGLTHLSKEAK